MKTYLKTHQSLAVVLSTIISVLLVVGITYAVTTISTNLSTGSATTTANLAVGTNAANDDDMIYFDQNGEYFMWDDSPGEFDLTDDLNIGGKATSTGIWAGAGGTVDNIDMANDIYVQDDIEIDGSLWVDSATTTDSLAIGGYASSTGDINTQADVHVGGNIVFDGNATSSAATTSYIYIPRINFRSVATSSNPNTGECFIPSNGALKCWDGLAWQELW